LFSLTVFLCFLINAFAQNCPANLDFERSSFDGWTCYVGTAGHQNGVNVISLSQSMPYAGRHTMFTRSAFQETDPYGGFPVICPNGSGHSIRLGNDQAGTEAEGVSYEFSIPANRNEYSLIYHYAVVFQDPAHRPFEQPRMVTEITNVSDNQIITCSSFEFYPVGSPLPGFFQSTTMTGNTPVWCKNWTAVSINLNGLAGKTIRLFFKTADCTFRRHFGYAYIDVNSECSGEFTGATFCRGDSAVQVEAPHGYQEYTWFKDGFAEVLGKEQTLTLRPAPAAGTRLAVEVVPYNGYGCTDTLYAKLIDTLTVKSLAGIDKRTCFGLPEEIGMAPRPGIIYSWSPTDGLSDAVLSNPFASPTVNTNYVLTSSSFGGGCRERDTVVVTPVVIAKDIELRGKEAFCVTSGDTAVLYLAGEANIQWYRNDTIINGAENRRYAVNKSGTYHALLSKEGCSVETDQKTVTIERPHAPATYPVLWVMADSPVEMTARPLGTNFVWQPATFLSTPSSATTVFSGATDQLYTVRITTQAGCTTVDTQAVKIVGKIDLLVPTAFTPNGDGRNDILRPILFGMKKLNYFRVYNRWGQLLFRSSDPQNGWDGRYAGKVQGNQTVVWVAEGTGPDGKRYVRKGTSICIQ
jgi:gliding motility-associated-like protein